jgi:hypothetical protein
MIKTKVKPELKRYELIKLLGGRKRRGISRGTASKIDRLEDEFAALIRPTLYYRHGRISSAAKGSVHIEEGCTFRSPKLSKALSNCMEAVCFIATIGEGIDEEIRRFQGQNRFSKAYILDAMGSLAIESIVDQFQERMKARYQAEGKDVSLRFSPGYCDWPILEQKKLFHFFDAFQLDVKLTDSCLMQPRKSVSGVFGVLPSQASHPAHPYNPCLECHKETCIARRI